MIDGSSDNSILNLIFGYNGFGRLTGGGGGPGGGGGGGGNFSGATGVSAAVQRPDGRAGLVAAAGGAARAGRPGWSWRRRAPRTDRTRAALLLWGSWLVVSGARVQLQRRRDPHLLHGRAGAGDCRARRRSAPRSLWRRREQFGARGRFSRSVVAVTAAWSIVLLRPHALVGAVAARRWSRSRPASRSLGLLMPGTS